MEDSTRIQAPAEASVDVLFAAFEKFLKCAWADAMGPVLHAKLLGDMQAIFGKQYRPIIDILAYRKLDLPRTPQTTERFSSLLAEMTPQNRRTFARLLALLAEYSSSWPMRKSANFI